MMRTIPLIAPALIALVLNATALAAPPIRIDSRSVLDALFRTYSTTEYTERLLLTHRQGPATRTAEVIIRSDPYRVVTDIEFGDLIIRVDPNDLYAVHRLNANHYATREVPWSHRFDALRRAIPSQPIPQINLALAQEADIAIGRLTTYTSALNWEDARLDPDADPPIITLRGSNDDSAIELTVNPQTNRILTATISFTSTDPTIEVRSVPPHEHDHLFPDLEIRERTPVPAIMFLAPAQGDLAQGRLMPRLNLTDAGPLLRQSETGAVAANPIASDPPRVLVFLRERTPEIEQLLAALRDEVRNVHRAVQCIAVVKLPADSLADFTSKWRADAPDLPLALTTSPASTIDRLDPEAEAIAVSIGPDNRIARIIRLSPAPAEDPIPAILEQARQSARARATPQP